MTKKKKSVCREITSLVAFLLELHKQFTQALPPLYMNHITRAVSLSDLHIVILFKESDVEALPETLHQKSSDQEITSGFRPSLCARKTTCIGDCLMRTFLPSYGGTGGVRNVVILLIIAVEVLHIFDLCLFDNDSMFHYGHPHDFESETPETDRPSDLYQPSRLFLSPPLFIFFPLL